MQMKDRFVTCKFMYDFTQYYYAEVDGESKLQKQKSTSDLFHIPKFPYFWYYKAGHLVTSLENTR